MERIATLTPANEHQCVAAHDDAVCREVIGEFATGECSPGECFGDQGGGVFLGSVVDVFLFELSFPIRGSGVVG